MRKSKSRNQNKNEFQHLIQTENMLQGTSLDTFTTKGNFYQKRVTQGGKKKFLINMRKSKSRSHNKNEFQPFLQTENMLHGTSLGTFRTGSSLQWVARCMVPHT